MPSPQAHSSPTARGPGLALFVSVGFLAGAAYVGFDLVSEARIGAGTLHGTWASLHHVVDHTLPLVAGVLLGIAAHYMRVRARWVQMETAAGRAEALRTRLQKLERDQAVWVLVAAVLHEINNPLHAIGLALDELEASRHDPAIVADLVARVRAQSTRVLAKLKELRSMRAVGEPEMGMTALDDVVERIAVDLGALVREEGLTVRMECERPVRATADPEYVRTIVENLVDNSLQSLREHGGQAVTVSVERRNGRAIVRVTDDAPPLDPPLDDSIFEPLKSSRQRGLGLGLPISRALARAMHGDVVLDTAPRSSFRFELPIGEHA